jgi:16S rRNA (uracil1498-N3)-methyltransferase
MPLPRLFSTERLQPHATVSLDGERAHYAGRVLRLRAGDELIVFDGSGGEYGARIDQVTKREMHISTGSHVAREAESALQLHLVQALAKGEKMDFVVQKATELGAVRISPVHTDHSVVKLAGERAAKRRDHWQKVAQSACEQCGRNRVPIVDAPQSLLNWMGDNAASELPRFMLQPGASDSLAALRPNGPGVILLVGPEGGFSEAEYARAAAAGLQAVRLGPRILRTETAAIAALSAAQAAWGDL